jgi:uncharacterized coiled-coil protein SlyX
MPPLDGVINDLNDRLSKAEKKIRGFNSQVAELGKAIAVLETLKYSVIKRLEMLEEYAK